MIRKKSKMGTVCRNLKIPAFAGMFLCAALLFTPVKADTAGMFSAAYLMELCKSDAKGETVKGGHTACQSYISGVIDYHKLMKSLGTAPTMSILWYEYSR